MDTDRATVFVIDDEESVRRALERLLRSAGWNVESCACAGEFLARLPFDGVGCVLLDMQMPGITGLELQAIMVEMGVSLPIVYLTGHGDVGMSVSAMKHGAMDILVKPVADGLLFDALEAAVAKHEALVARTLEQRDIVRRLSRLSSREREVMEHVIRGRLNKQIAADLAISEKTVKKHRARVMEKLEIRSLAGLVRLCSAAGVGPSGDAWLVPPRRLRNARAMHAH